VRTRNTSAARRHDDDPQIPLLEKAQKPVRLPHTIEQVRACHSEVAAIELACRCSGMLDKQIAQDSGIDDGNFSKIRRGQRGFMPGQRLRFMDAVGNQILREWEIERQGFDAQSLRRHEDNKDKRIAELEEENAELRRENSLLRELIQGRR
jgi:hypothetical protein